MRLHWVLLLPMILVAASRSFAQTPVPELRFNDPAGFYRSWSYPPADFSSQEVNASMQVYPFRVFNGDIRQAFSRTLLREMIDARYQEASVLPGGRLEQHSMPGADTVLSARFQEGNSGQPRERMRLALVRGNAVAILDVSAISWASWQRIGPQFLAFTSTLSIGPGSPPPAYGSSPTSGAGRAVAGLYMGFTTKWEALFGNRPALYYYLFSADGRVYRAYDDLSVPGNDPARFDFAAAKRADPVNSGQYTIRGNSMVVRLGASETFEVPLPTKDTIVIRGVSYERQ